VLGHGEIRTIVLGLMLAMFLAAAGFSNYGVGDHRVLGVAMIGTLVLFWSFPIYFLLVAWHCLYLMCPVLLLFTYSAVLGAKYLGRARRVELECVVAR
jgi:hypothetical protein